MRDLISRQAAIDAVEFGITYAKVFNKYTGEVTDLFKKSNEELQKAVDRIESLPSAQPEKLTDKEQRIILSAMCRETRLCKEVDEKYPVEEKDTLEFVCKEILRKVKKALW